MANTSTSNTKLYPFSVQKHAHDIEYRYNRAKIEMCDMIDERRINLDTFDKLEELCDNLVDLMHALRNGDGRVCWLTGKQYGLAKECVIWASNRRISSL